MTDRPFTEKQGSPPPMRGKAVEVVLFTILYGITPAYAGKRQQDLSGAGSA